MSQMIQCPGSFGSYKFNVIIPLKVGIDVKEIHMESHFDGFRLSNHLRDHA